jgi:hypothetical protein
MPNKLKPSENHALFEYMPHEGDVSDEEMCEIFFDTNQDLESIFDKDFKKTYLKYLETHKK